MCLGGGSTKASDQAQEAEDKRRADIERTQKRIESIFGSEKREGEIEDFINATRGILQTDLDRTKGITDRQLKFSLARSGQAGGSTDVDQNRNLSELFLRATVEGERRAQSAGANVRAADQEAKLNLFNQALGGLDMTTASSNSLRALQSSIATNRNIQSEGNFDAFFSDFGDLFTASRKTAGERRQREEFNTLFGRRPVNAVQVAGGVS